MMDWLRDHMRQALENCEAPPYLRMLEFTRPLQRENTKVAIAAILRQDSGTRMYCDDAGRIVAVYSGRDYSPEISYIAGKFESSNPHNMGYTPW